MFQSATKVYSTCRSYVIKLTNFSDFIMLYYPKLEPQQINRTIILNFLNYLNTISQQDSTKRLALLHLRTFLEIVAQEEWLPFPQIPLIFNSDLPRPPSPIPRFIPEMVMSQLLQNLHALADHHRRLIFILQETGRRISEICTLPFNCLSQDNDEAYFLEVTEKKTKKSYLIPITNECAKVIKEQQGYLKSINKENIGYLFLGKSQKSLHACSRQIHNVLNQLAEDKQIRNADGKIWHFHPHQFRHTVGTRMINAGVSQPIVQRYLGHETPEMTSRYAYVHDRTLKDAFFEFQGNLVTVLRNAEEQWLKRNIMAQALPNGYCGLPAKQERCPHANACLTCAHFRTDQTFILQHERQLEETNRVIDHAKKSGWKRQIEMNQEIKINLETIIAALKGKKHESA